MNPNCRYRLSDAGRRFAATVIPLGPDDAVSFRAMEVAWAGGTARYVRTAAGCLVVMSWGSGGEYLHLPSEVEPVPAGRGGDR